MQTNHIRHRQFSRRARTVAMASALAIAAALSPTAARADTGGASTFTFDSDTVGSVPAGCATPDGLLPAAVSDEVAYQGGHSLRVDDASTTGTVGVACTVAPQQGAYLSLEVNPRALQG